MSHDHIPRRIYLVHTTANEIIRVDADQYVLNESNTLIQFCERLSGGILRPVQTFPLVNVRNFETRERTSQS